MMRKDNLERFIRDNREAFDDKEPPVDLWQKLEAGLAKQHPDSAATQSGFGESSLADDSRPVNGSPFKEVHKHSSKTGGRQIGWPNLDWRVAASVALLILAGGFFYMNHQYGVTQQPEIVAAAPSYAKEVVQYTRLIDEKRSELKQMTEDNPALYQEFATDLNRLEHSYQSLKSDLPRNPNQEMLIQAMIQNLQLQINLLNEQLRVIQRIKQQTNEYPV
mgnify:CR=1 FL=1